MRHPAEDWIPGDSRHEWWQFDETTKRRHLGLRTLHMNGDPILMSRKRFFLKAVLPLAVVFVGLVALLVGLITT